MELKQAMVDGEGLRRFCDIAASNVDNLDDGQWRTLLETMKLSVLVDGDQIMVKVAVPVVESEKSVIAGETSQGKFRGQKCP